MNHEVLRSYLHDHLAGSTTGLELIDFLISLHKGKPSVRFFEELRHEVEADRITLQSLIEQLDFHLTSVRQAAAWAMEKLVRVRFLLAGPSTGSLGELEALEMLAAGIEAKRALWAALTVVTGLSALQSLDLEQLQRRARAQHAAVEEQRLEAARAAFRSSDQG